MKTNKTISIIFSILILAIIVLSVIVFKQSPQGNNINKEVSKTEDKTATSTNDCEFTSNGEFTDCIFLKLDRKAAEREWKQLKLESVKIPSFLEHQMMGTPAENQKQLKDWRLSFEAFRDKDCDIENVFYAGSLTPAMIYGCKLDFEERAIEKLNDLHQKLIEQVGMNKIKGFEPKESDLLKLMETNTTNAD